MTTLEVVLAVANIFQVIALAWIGAWQQRAAHEVRTLNGTVLEAAAAVGAARGERS